MPEQEDNPVPDQAGEAAEAQSALPPGQSVAIPDLVPHPFVEAVDGIAAEQPRLLGGETGAQFLRAMTRQMGRELMSVKADLAAQRQENATLRNTEVSLRVDIAKHEQRELAESGAKPLKNLAILVGTALLSLAYDLLKDKATAPAIACALASVALIYFGWSTRPAAAK